jgi:hypothetical protein
MFRTDVLISATRLQQESSTLNQIHPEDIERCIVSAQFHVFPGTCVTTCCLTLHNGFYVVGTAIASDPAIFDRGMGREAARANAVEKVWGLERYRLKDWLKREPLPMRPGIRYSPSEMAPLETRPVDIDTERMDLDDLPKG